MTNYIKTVFSLLLSFIILNSCIMNHSNKVIIPPTECIKLNNSGVEYLMNYPMNGEKGLNKSIDLFKQAIQCDSTYLNAYIGLANAYGQKKSYKEEMLAYNKLLVLANNDPSLLTQKGVLFERMNKIDSAKKIYYLTKIGFENRLAKTPGNPNLISGMVFLTALIDGKNAAIKELNEQIKAHPELSPKLAYEYEYYKYFDRHAYVYGLPTEVSLKK